MLAGDVLAAAPLLLIVLIGTVVLVLARSTVRIAGVFTRHRHILDASIVVLLIFFAVLVVIRFETLA